MAKRKKPGPKPKHEPRFSLSEDAKREIIAILLITLAIFVILASLGVAGVLGRSTLNTIKILVGLAAYILPLTFILVAWVLFQPDRFKFRGNNLAGLAAFYLFLSAILHLLLYGSGIFSFDQAKRSGGLFGYGLSQIMLPVLNKPVALIILFALLLVSLVIASDTRIRSVFSKIKQIFTRTGAEDDVKINDPSAGFGSKLPIRGTLRADKGEAKPQEALTLSEDGSWKFPPLDLLEGGTTRADAGNVKENAAIIGRTLSEFGIDVKMEDVNIGPSVAQYSLKPSSGVKLNKITTLEKDLALALAAHPIRIEAPIPGKSLVGVEVPNKKNAVVRLRDALASDEMERYKSKLKTL